MMGLCDPVPERHVTVGFSEALRSFWAEGGNATWFWAR